MQTDRLRPSRIPRIPLRQRQLDPALYQLPAVPIHHGFHPS